MPCSRRLFRIETAAKAAGRRSERDADRQRGTPGLALLHGDGGVLSSHVSLVLERQR